jgi:thioredoxin-dependent peroxiredoxin
MLELHTSNRLGARSAESNHRSNGPVAFPPKAAVGSATMKLFLALLFSVALSATRLFALSDETTNGKLKLGDPIPTVSATDQDGKPVNLSSATSGYVLVYFYPKAMTAGCTAQACSIRDAYTDLQNKGVKVFGVSVDTVNAQKEFQQKDHLPFELLSDTDHKVLVAFGVPLMREIYATRQAYLFKDGKLIWIDTKASTDKQAQDVLAVLANKA